MNIINCEKCKQDKHKRAFKLNCLVCKECLKTPESFSREDKENLIKEILSFKDKLK